MIIMAFGKIIDGQIEMAPTVLNTKEATYINPTPEQYAANGYKELVYCDTEVEEYTIEETEKCINIYNNVVTVEDLRKRIHEHIDEYNNSIDVNEFIFKGQSMWLTPAERNQLLMTLNAAKLMNKSDITVVYNGKMIPLVVDEAIMLIYMIEDYARECAVVTAIMHEKVDALDDKKSLYEFDYREGYPEKIIV